MISKIQSASDKHEWMHTNKELFRWQDFLSGAINFFKLGFQNLE